MTADATLAADIDPTAFLQLAGHPLRWRLLGELASSDRLVSELSQRLGEAQSLVSYHLGKLRGGRLVSARRSDADGRDAYYGLELDRFAAMLSATGGALHPGLRMAPAPHGQDAAQGRPVRVLFLCTGNSARSQMAQALIQARSGGAVEAVSAGSRPKALHPNAIRAMAEGYGLDLTGQEPKHFDVFAGERFDWVISLCDLVREVCPEFPAGRPQVIHWSVPNPATGEPDEVTWPLFQQTAAELATRIDYLLARIGDERGGGEGEAR